MLYTHAPYHRYMPNRFVRGSPIILRSVTAAQVGAVLSETVAQDDEELLALYRAPGYPCKRRAGVRGGPGGRLMLRPSGEHEDWIWGGNRVLLLYRWGDAHSVQLFWRATDDIFLDWYIDLHEPLRRTDQGFDSRDHALDVVIQPDRGTWRWKDEEEFAWYVEHGRLPQEEAEAIRAEGVKARDQVLRDEDEFYRSWLGWRPDAGWPVPTIPAGWKQL
jgi:uncharacterized protein